MTATAPTIWTVGHSTLAIADLVALLRAHRIEIVADVRRFPGSRRLPWFGEAALREELARASIRYEPLPELGGRRRPRPDSPNDAWRNEAFRGYADYMETAPFRDGVARLLALAAEGRTAILCAEAVWWRCHRALVADFLRAGGATVLHILGPGAPQEHPYTSAARLVDGRLSYRAGG